MVIETVQRPRPDRLKLVLLPGLDGTAELFAGLLDTLPPEIEAVVVRYPAGLRGGYDELESYLRPLLPVGRFVVLGESFSGPLALRLAADATLDVVAAVLVASFVRRPITCLPGWARFAIHSAFFRLPISSALLRFLLLGSGASNSLVQHTQKILASSDPNVLADRVRAALSIDASETLLRSRGVLLYIGGAQDRLIRPRTPADLKSARPDLEVTMLLAPHFVLQRAPESAARTIVEFLTRHGLLPRGAPP